MEKIITIDKKEFKLQANAKNIMIYHAEFGSDFFAAAGGFISRRKDGMLNYKDINALDLARLMWCMTKTADSNTKGFDAWFYDFETFPVIDVYRECIDLIRINIITTVETKNGKAAAKK